MLVTRGANPASVNFRFSDFPDLEFKSSFSFSSSSSSSTSHQQPFESKVKELPLPSVYVFWQPLPNWPATATLSPLSAPWHVRGHSLHEHHLSDGSTTSYGDKEASVPPGRMVKWLSYGPNMHATRAAQAGGFQDALLVTPKDR